MLVFWRRRAATQRGLRLAVGAVVLVSVLGTTLAVGVSARQPDVAVRAALRTATASDASMVWERQAATDREAQDAATVARLHRAFPGVPIEISSSAVADPIALPGGDRTALPLRADADLRAATTSIPELARGQLAIDQAGARALGVGVGDRLRLSTDAGIRELVVAAIWRARDPRAPIWNGIAPGSGGTTARIVLAPAELAADRIDLIARWSVAPDPTRIRAADLPALEAGYARLAAAAAGSTSFAHLEGGGAATATAMREGAAAAAAVVPVSIALLAAAAMLALLLLVRLLAEVRTDETALLRARGAARGQIAAGDLRAALLPVLGGAVAGWLVAQVALLLVAPPSGWAELALPFAVSTAIALVTVVAASVPGPAAERAGAGRGGRIAAVVGAVLLALLAAVGVVRLLGAGVGADPAAELAPALVVAALVLAGLLLGAPLAATADAITRRRDGAAPALATRRLRRRPGLVAGALVLLALAVGASGFAAGTVASSSGFLRDSGRLVTGGDVDVVAPGAASVGSGSPSPDVDRLSRIARATGSAPALVESVGIGDLEGTLSAAPVSRMPALQAPGLADTAALAGLAGPDAGIPLSGGGSVRLGIRARAASAPAGARIDITAWLVRSDGAAVRLDLPGVRIGAGTLDGRLPASAAWRLVALDAAVQSSASVTDLTVAVSSVARRDTGGDHPAPLPGGAWTLTRAVTPAAGSAASGPLGWSVTGVVDATGGRAELGRLMPAGSSVVAAAVSRPLATAAGLGIGDRATLDAGATGIPVRVAAVVPHTVGATGPSGVFVDLPSLQVAQLRSGADLPRPDHAWLAVPDPAAAAGRVADADPAVTATAAPAATVGRLAVPAAVAATTAAVGTVLYALLGMGTAIAALLRARRAEVAVLRALGASSRLQRRAARIELLSVLVYAAVVGAVAALAAVVLTVPALAHAAAPGIGPDLAAPIALDPLMLGAALLALAVGAALGLAVQERVVRRVAEHPPTAEVER